MLAACSTPAPPSDTLGVDSTAVRPAVFPSGTWPGYYSDTLPCADCPGIETALWVRSDSTFILQQRYLERDSLPFGTVGQWHVVNGLLTIGYTGDKPDFYRWTKEGLLMVDEMGQPFDGKIDFSLDKLADETGDDIPRMLLTGTYTYAADAHSFQPCGSRFTWPCAAGVDLGEEEGTPSGSLTNADLERAYLKAVQKAGDPWVVDLICTMGMGPAMEGDGADEYVYVERVAATKDRCP